MLHNWSVNFHCTLNLKQKVRERNNTRYVVSVFSGVEDTVLYGVFYAAENRKKTDIFDDRFVRTKWATASWKVWTLAIAPLTWVRLVTSIALQYRKWQLIGMSKWCHAFGLKINARDIVSIRKLDTFSTLLLLLSSICYCLSHCAVPVFAYILDLLV